MAEILGVAASGIAVATVACQIGSIVFELRQLWDQVQNVPEEINGYLRHIECLEPLLSESNTRFYWDSLPHNVRNNPVMVRTTQYCRESLEDMKEVVYQLDTELKSSRRKKRITTLKVILKRNVLTRLEKRLENAVRLLGLAQNNYLFAITMMQPEVIIQKFQALKLGYEVESPEVDRQHMDQEAGSRDVVSPQLWRDEVKEDHPSQTGKLSVAFDTSGFKAALQMPLWLSRRAWEMQSFKALGHWQFSLRSYSIRPDTAAVFATAETGTPLQLELMFREGSGSPHDCDVHGRSLLYYATRGACIANIGYIRTFGVAFSGTEHFSRTREGGYRDWSLGNSIKFFKTLPTQREDIATDIAEANVVAGNIRMARQLFENLTSPICTCTSCYVSVPLFTVSQQFECPRHSTCSLESRIVRAFHIAYNWGIPDVCVSVLEPEWSVDIPAVCRLSSSIFPLICVVAYRLGTAYSSRHEKQYYDSLVSWYTIAEIIIRHTPDIHVMCPRLEVSCKFEENFTIEPMSALLTIVHSCTQIQYASTSAFYLEAHGRLSAWIRACLHAGVDLVKYGQRENESLARMGERCSMGVVVKGGGTNSVTQKTRFVLKNFKYGPKLEDWDITWLEMVASRSDPDESASWPIPGSWVDDGV
ncbi:hypothetical protein PFICI_07335 [Pestalotiopsis fici W106-1]|uniref:Uncharacterized protein n=1 Tax=Pestalotiopsis fici (strain W106-1 / CGMCC3.15140) TaxID=1229662 RepID=W3X3S9_PESFW|nr:uncharacterized protein PFICI_07335 [Pestalotiopsis fici W106-1]ETS79806.1 hypothetical protein PFICI_07335 [Pestalotiopsis fici W106-1]